MGKVTNTKGSFQKKLAEMKKKIKQANQDANGCDAGRLIVKLFAQAVDLTAWWRPAVRGQNVAIHIYRDFISWKKRLIYLS